jgi:hypothetical protein
MYLFPTWLVLLLLSFEYNTTVCHVLAGVSWLGVTACHLPETQISSMTYNIVLCVWNCAGGSWLGVTACQLRPAAWLHTA